MDVSRVPNIGFVARQIGIHREHQARQQSRATLVTTFQHLLEQLETSASTNDWSQRKLAERIGIPDRTLRRLKRGESNPAAWLPKLQSACIRLHAA